MAKTALMMTGAGSFSHALGAMLKVNGWKILASSGTTLFLREQSVEAADVYDGKAKGTGERELAACDIAKAILGDKAELTKLGVDSIDLVAVTLTRRVDHSIDFGGTTILLAALHGGKMVVNEDTEHAAILTCLREEMTPFVRVNLHIEARKQLANHC
ncbi:MAG: hypothetical protein V4486_00330 [Patescibacteria group bacterium]